MVIKSWFLRLPLKITVLKKLSSEEIYGQRFPEVAEELDNYCNQLEVGQEFIVDKTGGMPSGFCPWAWHDIYPVVTGLQFGANYYWIKKEGLVYSCCSDGTRPVFFKIERL
jgi:uncharacterized repeat protein (TIGR04076 family)